MNLGPFPATAQAHTSSQVSTTLLSVHQQPRGLEDYRGHLLLETLSMHS